MRGEWKKQRPTFLEIQNDIDRQLQEIPRLDAEKSNLFRKKTVKEEQFKQRRGKT